MGKINEITEGIMTGFEALDNLLNGMRGGELVVLAARPAMGKTSFALEIVNHLAIGKEIPCLYCSLEHAKKQMENRLIYLGGYGTYERLRDGDAPIYIEDDNSLTVDEICSMAREYKEKHKIGFIVVDYLQLMISYHEWDKATTDALDCLKKLAVELDVPIMVLSQLSRIIGERENKRPEISDLTSIYINEDKVDTMMFIYRDDYYDIDTKNPNTAEIIIAKNCKGDTGTVELGFCEGRYWNIHKLCMLNSKYTFDNFVVGNSNVVAAEACMEIVEAPAGERFNPLFICGSSGVGKTHLMQAVASGILKANDKAYVLYISTVEFVEEVIDALKNASIQEFRDKYKNVDVFLIDDIQFIMDKEATLAEVFNIFNTFYNNNKQIIISSSIAPQDRKGLNDRIKSRFESGLVVNIEKPDYETRVAILKEMVKRKHLGDIPEEVFVYIADGITDNVRRLEGAINIIAAHFEITNEKVTLEGVKECLKNLIK